MLGSPLALDAVRAQSVRDPKGSLREAARQFEALFMQELMKSMRQATMSSGLLDNAGGALATEMLDQQFAQQLTGAPGGLADLIARQLERQTAQQPARVANAALHPAHIANAAPLAIPTREAAFVAQHRDAARHAETETGIQAAFMIAQAAHESGWGRREIRHADGTPSHNLFGIKAGAGWTGPVAEVTTTEFEDGVPRKVTGRFRAYASHAESFRDYARLMKDSPRYRDVLASGASAQAFAHSLQRAGYATDPHYAQKIAGAIETTLRVQEQGT